MGQGPPLRRLFGPEVLERLSLIALGRAAGFSLDEIGGLFGQNGRPQLDRVLLAAKARPTPDGKPGIDIAIPSFGYKSSISICRAFGFIRKGKTTDGARFDGRMLRDVVTNDNTASDVWADTAYRSQTNEAWLKRQGRVSRIHRKKPRGRPMPERTAKANAAKSKIRARVEHVFAHQKAKMGLFIRTIGIKRAEAKIILANLAYNMNRLIFHERRAAMG